MPFIILFQNPSSSGATDWVLEREFQRAQKFCILVVGFLVVPLKGVILAYCENFLHFDKPREQN